MGRWLNTRGKWSLVVTTCDRCHIKYPIIEMVQDPDIPSIWACETCVDFRDPWRLPPRATEDISLQHPRPDLDIVTPSLVSPIPLPWTADSSIVTADSSDFTADGGFASPDDPATFPD